ncbi:hypothetical protein ACEPAF_3422 [Sanghuangporus sanghuang]
MGFCRRCGDIVSGVRCKCGGLAVRASVDFSQTASNAAQPDLWSRTYVRSTPHSPSPIRERSTTLPASTTRPFSDTPTFSRPKSTYFSHSTLSDSLVSHIESNLTHDSQNAVKIGAAKKDDIYNASSSQGDILPDPNTSTLAKAYGSVLQPKESLSIFACVACSNPFPPDATIYPDPNEPTTTTRFLCKSCFTTNGGAKGDCASCGKPILILTSEGGFIENAARIWHKRCFRCDGCFRDISDRPMVDILGRPSCEDCFDTCLKRPRADSIGSKRASLSTPDKVDVRSNPGGMKRGTSREGSPAIEELQQRLGIKSRESSPLIGRKAAKLPHREASPIPDFTHRLSNTSIKANQSSSLKDAATQDSPSKTSDASPSGRYARFRLSSISASSKPLSIHSPSPRAENHVVDDMEWRVLRRSFNGSPSPTSFPSTVSSRDSLSGAPYTPDLTDSSSCASTFSPPSTPCNSSPEQHDATPNKTPTKLNPSQTDVPSAKLVPSSPSTPCAKCLKPLFRTRCGGKFVTVPEESSKRLPPKSYHTECFRCAVCEKPFEETKNGQAIFIRTSTGCCHINCTTPERIVIRPIKTKSISVSLTSSSTKQDKPPITAPPAMSSFPRFGCAGTCPGCRISVSPMERGVVPGPQGSRWHASCLVCGGKGAQSGLRRTPNTPGCGKRLDSAAKTDGDGGVWCRECLLLIDSVTRQESPTRPLEPSFTGTSGMFRFPSMGGRRNEGIAPQLTGMTTIARQFTGMGALTSQLTGSGLNPTRQLPRDINRSPSPTKGVLLNRFNEGRRAAFPRPKSVGGIRGKSIDEGRGMFLVRQLTGNGAGLDP